MKYIIVGKAASGKDFLQKRMVSLGYHPMKQYTTRDIRDNETGDEYHFISLEKYKIAEDGGTFLSSNFYRIGWYGISYAELINNDVAILSPANIKDVFEKYPDIRNCFTVIYLDIPVEIRRERLSRRYSNKVGDDNEVRIANDERDFKDFKDYDIKLETTEDINNFINNLSSIEKNK